MAQSYKGITIKFGADTTDLGSALKEIDQQAKSVTADLKEIDKGLKLDPKNVELLDKKFRAIGEAVQLSQKRLDALKQAQAKAALEMKNGAEGAEERYKALEREIQQTENTLSGLKSQAKATADAVKKDLTDAVDKFAGQVKKLSVTVGAVVTALGGLTFSAASSADELNTLSKVTGISTEELQKFQYASSLIDVSVETLRGSLQRLTRNMSGASDESGSAFEAFKALGVEIKDSNGELRNNTDVFYEVIDALGEIDNATQRDAYAMQIFGRSAQELNPLIIAGSQALKEFGDQADEMGLIFDQETLDNLNEVQDKIDVAKQQLKGTATIIGGELADAFDEIFNGADGLLKMVQQAKEDGTLKEIAESVADTVSVLIEILGAAAKFVYKFRDAIAGGVTALIAYKAALGISNIITAAAKAVNYFTAAQEAATGAQTAFNSAASVNPYAVLAAAAVALTVTIIKLVTAENEAIAVQNRYYDSVVESVHANNEAVKKYDEITESIERNTEARKTAVSEIDAEYYGYDKLIDELYRLSEEEDKSEGTKKRMSEIVDELKDTVPELARAYNRETGELSLQREEVEKLTEASKELRLAKAALANQAKLDEDIADVQLTINMLEPDLKKATEEYHSFKEDVLKKWIEKLPNQFDAQMSFQETLGQLDLIANNNVNGAGNEAVEDARRFRELLFTVDELQKSYYGAKNELEALTEKSEEYSKLIEKNKDQLSAEAEETEKASEAAEDLTEALEDQGEKYEAAKSKVSQYKSELTSLIGELQKVNEGTKYSTTQILDLIDKYPELASAVRLTAEGYELEAEGIQKLIDKKADLMIANAKEAEEAARVEMEKAKANYERVKPSSGRAMQFGFAAQFGYSIEEDVAEYQKIFEEADAKYKAEVAARESYERIVSEIRSGNIVKGVSGSSSSSSTTSAASEKADTTDYWKQAAENEIAEAEHLYKMGEITAEQYYKRLDEINRRYYENKAEYLTEYNKLSETVYAGLKKLEEDQLSSAKTLIDRINEVKKARESLENAENQKVSVYSGAAGFHTEQNTSAIESAALALQSKQLELATLLQQKFGANIDLPDMSGLDLSKLLPDLSGLKIPASESSQKTVNVSYQAGNIYITGGADQSTVDKLRELMNSEAKRFFDEALDDYIDQADRDRQTGGKR